jgi:hypothetical protein
LVDDGVHQPPGRAARGLLSWAVDLWPYINGKAIVNGVSMNTLEASDFLDVVHYFFEEDSNYTTPEQAVARSKMRKRFYKNFYEHDYKYGMSDEETVEVSENGTPIKPYIPPTNFDPDSFVPFGNVLDSPIN